MRTTYLALLLIFICTYIDPPTASATNILRESISEQQLLLLANDATWLDLLHVEPGSMESTVMTPDFFIASNGRKNPKAELEATIAAYNMPWWEARDKNPLCRFPARYYWLSQKVPMPDLGFKQKECQQLQQWPLLDSVQSISVLMVSGYLGNPASTFGHALIKFNTEEQVHGSNLFDLTLNYGALFPQGENPFIYIAKGLTGGYEAVFSDRYYYNRDLVYSHTEFREMWEYRLNLNDYERRLFLYHVWEITRKRFKYFFLKENCAYKIAELLDVVIAEDVLWNSDYWYAPLDLFNRLTTLDNRRRINNDQLISEIKYLPSSQRKLYSQLKFLSDDELGSVKQIVKQQYKNIGKQLDRFDSQGKTQILDALLTYHQYESIANGDSTSPDFKERQQGLLNARFSLPASHDTNLVIPEILAPTRRSPPIKVGTGFRLGDDIRSFAFLNWSPYSAELVGQNSHTTDELVVLDVTVGIDDGDRFLFFDKIDFLKIAHLNTMSIQIDEQKPWSWQLRFGLDQIYEKQRESLDLSMNFGFGRAWEVFNDVTFYAMLDIAGHSEATNFRATPQLGLLVKQGDFKAFGYYGRETEGYSGQHKQKWEGTVQYNASSKYAFKVNVTSQNSTIYSFGISRFY